MYLIVIVIVTIHHPHNFVLYNILKEVSAMTIIEYGNNASDNVYMCDCNNKGHS